MKKNFIVIIYVGALLTFVLGCSAIREIAKKADEAAEPKIAVSNDKKVQLTVPASWNTKLNMNGQAILQAAQPLQETYAIVIPDSKEDFDETVDLDYVTELVKKNTALFLENTEMSDPVSLKVGGFPARRFEISGTTEKVNIRYIFTVVDAPDSYYQIMAWTLKSLFEKNKGVLLEVSNSFELVDRKGVKTRPPSLKRRTTHKPSKK